MIRFTKKTPISVLCELPDQIYDITLSKRDILCVFGDPAFYCVGLTLTIGDWYTFKSKMAEVMAMHGWPQKYPLINFQRIIDDYETDKDYENYGHLEERNY